MTEAARCTRLSQCFSIKATSTLASHTAAISAGTLVPRGTKRWRCLSSFNRGQRSKPSKRACDMAKRSEEHTSELQSLMRISYAVLCLNKKKHKSTHTQIHYKDIVII